MPGPCACSATFSAASMASEPVEPRKTMSRSPGEIAARLAASAEAYCDMNAMQISWRFSSWNLFRAATMRGWLWPKATEQNPPKKSRILRPSLVM